jgi:hypothetical protein
MTSLATPAALLYFRCSWSIHILIRSYEEQTSHLARDRKMVQNIMHGKSKLTDYVYPDYLALAKLLNDKDVQRSTAFTKTPWTSAT